jgi:hypothetical protein
MSEGNGAGQTGEAGRTGASDHVLFLWSPNGYTVRRAEGDPPAVGESFESDGRTVVVTKIGVSPFPGDTRPCAYTVGK